MTGGAPFIPMLVAIAKSHIGGAVGLMLLLLIVTIFYIPLVIPVLFPDASVSSWEIAKSLIYSMLIPLSLALFVKARYSGLAGRILPVFAKLTNLSILVLVIALVYLYAPVIVASAPALPTVILFFLGSMAIGYCSGGRNRHARIILSIGTGLRNPPVAMLVASQYFTTEPMAAIVPLLVVIIGLSILFPLTGIIGKRAARVS